jgi:hypothetical protein
MSIAPTDPHVASGPDDETAAIAPNVADLQQKINELLRQLEAMGERLSQLALRESELRTILEREAELDPHHDRLLEVIGNPHLADHVNGAIEGAPLQLQPFPYIVIDKLLPGSFYRTLLKGIPPVQLFANKPAGKQHLDVPFALAPMYSHRIWRFMADTVVPTMIAPRILEKFRASTNDWIARNWPDLAPEEVDLHTSGGRIMMRRRGYRILPHRDPKWAFITCIFYLARPGDSEAWGTQLYEVDRDQEADTASPYWIDAKRCRCVNDVAFRPNRLLVFLNSGGAHGAHIPPDAEPETLERYIYQFRIGPPTATIARLKSMLPQERQPLWSGKTLVDY